MASLIKSLVSLRSKAALLVLLIGLAVETQMAQGQSCSAELSNLNVCLPFVLPGATSESPTADCCTALRSVQHDCLCSTLRIASQLPSHCNLPPLTCSN